MNYKPRTKKFFPMSEIACDDRDKSDPDSEPVVYLRCDIYEPSDIRMVVEWLGKAERWLEAKK